MLKLKLKLFVKMAAFFQHKKFPVCQKKADLQEFISQIFNEM